MINHTSTLFGLRVRFFAETQKLMLGKRNPFVLRIDLGNGAGYRRGASLYFARHSGSANWATNYRATPYPRFGIEAGCTRNANRVPYLAH